jgi:hypothetical protein
MKGNQEWHSPGCHSLWGVDRKATAFVSVSAGRRYNRSKFGIDSRRREIKSRQNVAQAHFLIPPERGPLRRGANLWGPRSVSYNEVEV